MSAYLEQDHMPGTVFLRGDRVTLNTVHSEDYTFVEKIHNEPAIRQQSGVSLPWDDSDITELVQEREDVAAFLICRQGEAIGTVLLFNIDTQAQTAEIGYTILPDEQNEGYATEAVELCVQHAFDDRGLQRIWAKVNKENEPSRRVLEKSTFQQEGLLRAHEYAKGERVDVCYYGLLASEW